MKDDVKMVLVLGEQIGYGHMMCIASALWRKNLKDKNFPVSGAFIPTCFPSKDKEIEEMIEKGKKFL